MLNNEFRLIGTIVSDWKKVGSENFPKHEVLIEVEKRKKGNPTTYKLTAFEKNYVIDVTKSLKGKMVIVTGYLDLNKNFINLVVQDFVVIGEEVKEELAFDKEEENIEYNEDGELVEEEPTLTDLPDDDLPF